MYTVMKVLSGSNWKLNGAIAEAYLEPYQTSTMEVLQKQRLEPGNNFCKPLHLDIWQAQGCSMTKWEILYGMVAEISFGQNNLQSMLYRYSLSYKLWSIYPVNQ